MVIKNKKIIGLIMLLFGAVVIGYMLFITYKMIIIPIEGYTTNAKVVGFKVSRNGARMVQNSSSIKNTLSGRSPFFTFTTTDNVSVTTYSNVLQIFVLFNYKLNEEIKIAYTKENPKQAIILSYKELPGIIFMLLFGLLSVMVGKNYLLKKNKY